MQEFLPTLFAVILVILTVILTVVGVQLILVLNSLRRALGKVNEAFDEVEQKVKAVTEPLQNLAGIASGVQTGVKVFEGFVGFLNRKKNEIQEEEEK